MRTVKWIMAVAAGVGLLVVGCGDNGSDDPGGAASGELPDGRTFLSTSVTDGDMPRSLADGTRIRLDFTGDDLRVDAGCNLLWFSPTRQDGDRLITAMEFTTNAGCSPDRLDQDDWLTGFLTSEPTLRLDGDSLRLSSDGVTIELLDIEVATPDRPLVGTRWRINTIIDGQSENSFNAEAEAWLIFTADGTVRGRTACNAFGARYQVDGSRLSVSRLVTTDAPCEGLAAELETALYDVLSGDSTVDIETNKLTLISTNGKGVSLRTDL